MEPTEEEPKSEEELVLEQEAERLTRWHRLMGMVFRECFKDFPIGIDTETDVSIVEQRVDIVLKLSGAEPPPSMIDGVDGFKSHNLITFKSFHESLTVDSVEELIGYSVGYKKKEAPEGKKLLPRNEVALYAIVTRKPEKLLENPDISSTFVKSGVYDLKYGSTEIRLVVIHELESIPQNANFLLFSKRVDQVQYAKRNHTLSRTRYTSLISELVQRYEDEGEIEMVDVLRSEEEEIAEIYSSHERTRRLVIAKGSVKERIEGLPTKDVIKELPVEEVVKELPVEKRLEGIPVVDRIKGLSAEERAELIKFLNEEAKPTT